MDAADFARACGYSGDSPALLEAFEAIRRDGIAHARQDHIRRKAMIDELKQSEILFLAAVGPALSAGEAIEDAAPLHRLLAQHAALAPGTAPARPDQGQAAAARGALLPAVQPAALGARGGVRTGPAICGSISYFFFPDCTRVAIVRRA
ncbi:hypothetical protein [Mesorhizobium sp. M1406]|uniref:hypothetical protein n=1 Tax=Mesorhizobium sp. M1406 TaxID=2957099 RepID=UPI00333B41AA